MIVELIESEEGRGREREREKEREATFNNRANSKETFRYCIPGQSYKLVGNLTRETKRENSLRGPVYRREKGSRRFISSLPPMENEQKLYIYNFVEEHPARLKTGK